MVGFCFLQSINHIREDTIVLLPKLRKRFYFWKVFRLFSSNLLLHFWEKYFSCNNQTDKKDILRKIEPEFAVIGSIDNVYISFSQKRKSISKNFMSLCSSNNVITRRTHNIQHSSHNSKPNFQKNKYQ